MSVGINSVREIIVRVPSLLREPDMGDFIEGTVSSVLCLLLFFPMSSEVLVADSLKAFKSSLPLLCDERIGM